MVAKTHTTRMSHSTPKICWTQEKKKKSRSPKLKTCAKEAKYEIISAREAKRYWYFVCYFNEMLNQQKKNKRANQAMAAICWTSNDFYGWFNTENSNKYTWNRYFCSEDMVRIQFFSLYLSLQQNTFSANVDSFLLLLCCRLV